jgi:hypothetical protein
MSTLGTNRADSHHPLSYCERKLSSRWGWGKGYQAQKQRGRKTKGKEGGHLSASLAGYFFSGQTSQIAFRAVVVGIVGRLHALLPTHNSTVRCYIFAIPDRPTLASPKHLPLLRHDRLPNFSESLRREQIATLECFGAHLGEALRGGEEVSPVAGNCFTKK